MSVNPPHLRHEQLAAFKSGHLAETEVTLVATHLGECEKCQAALEDLPEPEAVRRIQEIYREQPSGAERAVTAPPATDVTTLFRDHPRYRGLTLAGQGGMGVVYRAEQLRTGRPVALKVFRPSPDVSPEQAVRFLGEARKALDHPNIVPVYEAESHAGLFFIAMKWAEGGTLREQLNALWQGRNTALPHKELLGPVRQLAQAARALHYLHQRRILHRDVKPANILLDGDGTALLADFGLAKSLEGAPELTDPGRVLGTAMYIAPEVVQGGAPVTTAIDVYALGVTLYELLTGHTPFAGQDREAIFQQVRAAQPPAPAQVRPGADADLEKVSLKCLAKNPEERYASASEFADDLERWERGEPVKARPLGVAQRLWYWTKRNRGTAWLYAATLLLTLTALASGVFGLLRHLDAERQARESAEALAQTERRATHDNRALAAGARAARGDAAGADELFTALIEEGWPDQLTLRVERARVWFALNRPQRLEVELADLLAQPNLDRHAATVRLLYGDLLFCLRTNLIQARSLIEQALADLESPLSPADRAFAHGLLAERSVDALEYFRQALRADAFHHRAHTMVLLGTTCLGQLGEAHKQQAFMSRVFTHDPFPAVADILLDIVEKRNWKDIEPRLNELGTRLGKEQAKKLKGFLWLLHDMLTAVERGNLKSGLLSLAFKAVQLRLHFERGTGLLGQFGLVVPITSWLTESYTEAVLALEEAGKKNTAAALERLERAADRNPEAFFYWIMGTIHITRAAEHNKQPEEMHKHAEEAVRAFRRAAEAPTIAPGTNGRARIGATWIEAMLLRAKTPRDEDRARRVRDNIARIIAEQSLNKEDRTTIIPTFFEAADAEFARPLLLHWQAVEPANLKPVRFLALLEQHERNHAHALRLADQVLKDRPADEEILKVKQEALDSLRKLLETVPKPSKQE